MHAYIIKKQSIVWPRGGTTGYESFCIHVIGKLSNPSHKLSTSVYVDETHTDMNNVLERGNLQEVSVPISTIH